MKKHLAKEFKTSIVILLVLAMIFTVVLPIIDTFIKDGKLSEPKQTQAVITIDGKEVKFNSDMGYPLITNTQRILIPVRIVSENMGYNVDWSKDTWNKGIQKVWIDNGKTKVELEIGKSTALVNGKSVPIDIQDGKPVDTKATLVGSRTYVPVRFVSEALGAKIEYEMKNGVHYVNINTGKKQDTGNTGTYNGIKFDPKADVYEDGRMSEEKTLEFLDVMVENIKVYKENGKFYLQYDHIELPDGFSAGIGFKVNNKSAEGIPIALTTGTAYIKENQLPKDKSFKFELRSEEMKNVIFYNLSLSIVNLNSTNPSRNASASYSISYYPGNTSLNGEYNHSQIVIANKWGGLTVTKPFDAKLIFGDGVYVK